MILAGDIGGTKTALALFEATPDGLKPARESKTPSKGSGSFEQILDKFLDEGDGDRPTIEAACFGVAGPVIDGVCQTTNLPWRLSETELRDHLGAGDVELLNDLEAAAYGMLHLPEDRLSVINPGPADRKPGNVAVIAAGTGLGEAFLHWDGSAHHPIASEGGHTDFAPRDSVEDGLLVHLRGRFGGHVSYERVLSGPGLHNIYNYFRDTGAHPESPEVAAEIEAGDPNEVISRRGMAGSDPLSAAALDLFASIYGAEAGNLALKVMAHQVFVAGGIAPKILKTLEAGRFLESFLSKGRLRGLLKDVRLSVALDPRANLIGAAEFAARRKAPAPASPNDVS